MTVNSRKWVGGSRTPAISKMDLFVTITVLKMKFSTKDFFSNCDKVRRKLRIWSHLLKKSLMENFIFCVVTIALQLTPLKCSDNSFTINAVTECSILDRR